MNATRAIVIGLLWASFAPTTAHADEACIDCHVLLRSRRLRAPALDVDDPSRHSDPVRCTTCHRGEAVDSVRAHGPGTGFLARPVVPCIDCHLGPEARDAWLVRVEETTILESVPAPDAGAAPDSGATSDAGAGSDPVPVPGTSIPRPPPSPRVAAYLSSAHATAHLVRGDGPICSDCHRPHKAVSPSDPASSVHWTEIPVTCARCHGDPSVVGPAVEDPVESWARSVHGAAWAARGEDEGGRHGPGCADCHDPHGTLSADEAVQACFRCHEEIREAFDAGPHATAFERHGFLDCVGCHGSHEILQADASLVTAGREAACRDCHAPGQELYTRIGALGEALEAADEARRLIARGDETVREAAAPEISALVAAVHRLDVEEVRARSEALVEMAPAAPPEEEASPDSEDAVDYSRIAILASVALAIGVAFTVFWRRRRKR